MEIAYLHLVTNHIPIIGVPFAIALMLFGIWRKSDELKTASMLAFASLGALTIAVYLLGQGGEDFVEDLPGVAHDAIEDHEEIAAFALASVLAIAAVSVFALLRYGRFRPRTAPDASDTTTRDTRAPLYPKWIVVVVLALAIVSAGILGYTGRLGGKIRHPEFHGQMAPSDEDGDEMDAAGDENDREGRRRRGRNRGGR